MQLKDTIGAEEAVLVLVDLAELPRTWASLDLLSERIGEGTYRAEPQGDGSASELDPGWGADMSQAATALRGAAKITLGDLHLDAKLHTHLHPHGTGSLRAESDRVSMSEYLKNRLLSLQHDFRRSTVWSFQSLDRLIKNDLYFRHQARHSRQAQMPAAAVASASCLNP